MKPEQRKPDAVIIFSDGGAKPNPGFAGWGIHGYTFLNEKPKTGSGKPDYYVTDKGYVEKSFLDAVGNEEEGQGPYDKINTEGLKDAAYSMLDDMLGASIVTPLSYIDAFGPASGSPDDPKGRSSNNRGEALGLYEALHFGLVNDIPNIHVYADSEYAGKGYNLALELWKKNQWFRRDGTMVKNRDIWEAMWELKQKLIGRNVTVEWVQGHSIFLGNQLADMNATLGRNMSISGFTNRIDEVRPALRYWGANETEKHPLIAHQKMFYNIGIGNHEPGVYYMGAVEKDMGTLGKRLSDTSYSVLLLKEPQKELEKLIEFQCSIDPEEEDRMVVAHLGTYYKNHVQKQFMEYGTFSLHCQMHDSNSLFSVDGQIVSEIIDPPKRSMSAMLAVNVLHQRLMSYLDGNAAAYTLTDLTPHLYETITVQKKGKDVSVTKLKASIKPGVASIAVDANYRNDAGETVILPTTLTFGIDLADRNGLKRVEEFTPKVNLLTWEESPGVFRYFTVIQTNDDVGAYCGYYSNVRLNKMPKKKTK